MRYTYDTPDRFNCERGFFVVLEVHIEHMC